MTMKSPITDAPVAYPTEYTEDVAARLRVPVPESEIHTKKQGGATLRFTSDKFVKRRLDEVVGPAGWQSHYTVTNLPKPAVLHAGRKDESLLIGQVVCDLTILGINKSATADQEVTPDIYGAPCMNAESRALKRAAKDHGVAIELWDKDTDSEGVPATSTAPIQTRPAPAGKSNGQAASAPIDEVEGLRRAEGSSTAEAGPKGQGFATGPQIKFLRDAFLVPPKVARELTSGNDGTTSLLINYMKQKQNGNDAFEDEAPGYLHEALLHGFTAKNRAGEDVHVQPHMHLVKFVTFPADAPDEEEDPEDDED